MASSIINGSVDRSYFGSPRHDIEPLLPAALGRVLEIGCGTGATLAWLRSAHGAAETVGVELNPALEAELRDNADVAVIGSGEDAGQLGMFDTILLLDVLEHMADPWSVVAQLADRLRPTGTIIASVPNIVHGSVLWMMLRHRHFGYQQQGILDRTHLRFFVRETIEQLMTSSGLHVDAVVSMLGPPERLLARIVGRLPGRTLEPFITYQYLVRARRQPADGVYRTSKWMAPAAIP